MNGYYFNLLVNSSLDNTADLSGTNLYADFIGNHAPYFTAGIHNTGTMETIYGDFIGNRATKWSGAAISNQSGATINLIKNAVFADNSATWGGAIFNDGTIGKILNSNFFGNSVTSKLDIDSTWIPQGGAINSSTNILIESDRGETEFTGNYINNNGNITSNAIFMENKGTDLTLNLNSINSGTILFNDGIDGDEGYKISLTGDATSQIIFNEHIKNADIIADGLQTTTVTKAEYLGTNNKLTINSGAFNILDLGLTNLALNSLAMNGGDFNIGSVSADLANNAMGSLTSPIVSGTLNIKVNSVDIQTDGLNKTTTTSFVDNLLKDQITNGSGPVFEYGVSYDPITGDFTFIRNDYNPQVLVPSVATASVAVLSDEIYSRMLADIDNPFGSIGCDRKVGGAFVKTFTSNDSIDLKNVSGGADSDFSGLIAGFESDRINEGQGISAVYNVYAAYATGDNKLEICIISNYLPV